MENARAKTAEVDLISSLALASRQLRSYGDDVECRILVISSGLSTVSPLDFSNNLLHVSPEEIVSVLESRSYLVDLSFLDSFTWLYLGDTTSPQESLTPSNSVALKNIWSAILRECGVTDIDFAPSLPSENIFDEQLSDVKEVPIFRTVDDPAESVLEGPVVLDTDRVCFKFNSCEFTRSIDDVHAVLNPYADLLAANPDTKLLIAGMASNEGGEDYNRRLSLKRAKALKAELVALNASPKQLVCVG